MAVSYDKLWIMLIKRNINRSDLAKKAGVTSNAMANMWKNKYVNLEVLEKICTELDCKIEDIVEIRKRQP